MKILAVTGEVVFDAHPGCSIPPRITKSDFLASMLAASARQSVENGPYSSFVTTIDDADSTFTLILSFRQELCEAIHIAKKLKAMSWSEWAEEKEFDLKAEHDRILRDNFFRPPPYQFAWGSVVSDYDPRSGSSQISIRYEVPK